ncbi:hypothetical protein EV182_000100 [Spiromyces aspiralis]|uniref:Uncharacterized protein n=1 Tax=Spiromyces aspiralis TaxID=68401 RepID=A0ACC1I2L6_9FUNG|nr:hypothetical protein EV182_000100 [Spiromyces aspiralis]
MLSSTSEGNMGTLHRRILTDADLALFGISSFNETSSYRHRDQAIYNSRLGNAVYPFLSVNIASIVLSVIVIATVVLMLFIRRDLAVKPSFRLSAWIAATDIILSCIKIVQLHHMYMLSLPEKALQFIEWMLYFSGLAFMFLTDCIVLQLQLTVLHSKAHIAARLNPYYEAFSLGFALALAHPFMYLAKTVWNPDRQLLSSFASNAMLTGFIWGCVLVWMILSLLYCIITCFVLVLKLWHVSVSTRPIPPTECRVGIGSSQQQQQQQPMMEGADATFHSTSFAAAHPASPRLIMMPSPPLSPDRHYPDGHSRRSAGKVDLSWGGQYRDAPSYYLCLPPGPKGGESTGLSELVRTTSRTSNSDDLPYSENEDYDKDEDDNHTRTAVNSHVLDQHHGGGRGRRRKNRHRRHLQLTILRVMLYPLVPIITRTMSIVIDGFSLREYPAVANSILPASQGILNAIAFAFNPSLDEVWEAVMKRPWVQRILPKRVKIGSYRDSKSHGKDLYI